MMECRGLKCEVGETGRFSPCKRKQGDAWPVYEARSLILVY